MHKLALRVITNYIKAGVCAAAASCLHTARHLKMKPFIHAKQGKENEERRRTVEGRKDKDEDF